MYEQCKLVSYRFQSVISLTAVPSLLRRKCLSLEEEGELDHAAQVIIPIDGGISVGPLAY